MALSSANVRVGVTGELSVAKTTATAPTGTTGALTGFVGLGYVSDDGVTEERERDTETIVAWQNADKVRTLVTEGSLKFSLTLIESKAEVIELFYGSTVKKTTTHGEIDVFPTRTGGRRSFVLDVIDGDSHKRIYIPEGEVSEVGEIEYKSDEPIGYEVTIEAYASEALGGAAARIWDTSLKSASGSA